MKQVGPVLENLLKRYNLWQGYQQYLIVESWEKVVGYELGEVTRAKKIENGVLRVIVKDSVWAYHLSLLKPQLIGKLNNYAGNKVVKDIYFQIDELEKKEN